LVHYLINQSTSDEEQKQAAMVFYGNLTNYIIKII